MKHSRTYSELIQLSSFEDRFEYLRLGGMVGKSTFGFNRYLNQTLYTSPEWRSFRNRIILRDNGCDMAVADHSIGPRIIVHHITPLTMDDLVNANPCIFDPENVVCVSHSTHEAIHYGTESPLSTLPKERHPGDTCPWR